MKPYPNAGNERPGTPETLLDIENADAILAAGHGGSVLAIGSVIL